MKPHHITVFLFAFLVPLFSTRAQSNGVRIGKKNTWIESIDYNREAKPDAGQGSAFYYLLIDEQENTATEEHYFHYAYELLTSEGVQQMSDLSIDFDLAYQQLIIHEIKIIRGQQTINQIPKDFSVIQREESMDRYLYDGSKTLVVNLKDMRMGDIVEYSFTRKGLNPVNKGHIARTYSFDYYISFDKYFQKLVIPASKKTDLKSLGDNILQPEIKKVGNMTHYTWTMDKTNPRQSDNYTPTWFSDSRMALISDFSSWEQVGQWASGLFTVSQSEKDKIKKEAASMFTTSDDAEYILEVIRFVQDEVRYLGFETGINSHQPHAPAQILEQRFGDCKDKSLLLTTLLGARNIEAYPMLVNTTLKHKLDDRLPAGNIFDHCVVEIRFNDEKYYIDPTWSNQGGDLEHYYFPDYKRGLVIDDDITGLDALPEPAMPTTTELETIELSTIGGEAVLTVRTTYTGSAADNQRSFFAQTSLETIQENYLRYHANLYPDIEKLENVTFHDNRRDNVFTVEEKYKIVTFWKPVTGEENKIIATVQPMTILDYFDVPKNIQQRTSPYALSYPVDYFHHIHLRLPEEWTVSPIDQIIENDFYQYEYTLSKTGNELSWMTHYQTKTDNIPANRIIEYVNDHIKMFSNLAYQLTYDKNIAEASGKTLPGILTTIIALVVAVFVMFGVYHRYDPAPERYMVQGSPIGGWLVLMSIGLILTPFRLLYELVSTPEILTGGGWMAWLSTKQYGLFAYALLAHVYNVFKMFFSVLLVVLFLKRRSSFPKLMMIQLGTSFIMLLADTLVAQSIYDDPESTGYRDSIQGLVAAAIWIPYLAISQRVKDTFVIRADDNEDENENAEPQIEILDTNSLDEKQALEHPAPTANS